MNKGKLLLTVQAALCIALVLLLACSAIAIYREGSAEKRVDPLAQIYTPERIAGVLRIALPLFLAAAAVTVICGVKGIRDPEQDAPVKDAEVTRDLLQARVAVPSAAMLKSQKVQKKLRTGGWAGFGLCMIPILIYMTNGAHFSNGDLEQVIGDLALHVFPWIALGMLCLVASTVLEEKRILQETDAISARIREEKAAGVAPVPRAVQPGRSLMVPRLVLLVLAVGFIVAGVMNGSIAAVINKAIRICTECVGLG